jgi:hypothetical protein
VTATAFVKLKMTEGNQIEQNRIEWNIW